jgi:hypothetical protein
VDSGEDTTNTERVYLASFCVYKTGEVSVVASKPVRLKAATVVGGATAVGAPLSITAVRRVYIGERVDVCMRPCSCGSFFERELWLPLDTSTSTHSPIHPPTTVIARLNPLPHPAYTHAYTPSL